MSSMKIMMMFGLAAACDKPQRALRSTERKRRRLMRWGGYLVPALAFFVGLLMSLNSSVSSEG